MNIKNVHTAPIIPIDKKARVEGNSRPQGSADRDADGKRENSEDQNQRRMTQQEFDEALATLEAMPGLKANGLTMKVEESAGQRIVVIFDQAGKKVRRLTEAQLRLATRDRDRQTGRILDKAM